MVVSLLSLVVVCSPLLGMLPDCLKIFIVHAASGQVLK
jgi:hypothetical protein